MHEKVKYINYSHTDKAFIVRLHMSTNIKILSANGCEDELQF